MPFTNSSAFTVTRMVVLKMFLASVALTACSMAASCSSASSTTASNTGARIDTIHVGTGAVERLRVPAPGTILLEPLEGHTDTIEFHIGAPLFLRMAVGTPRGCSTGVGELFYFDATGSQLGWSFEEVTDSLLFPPVEGRCERIIMLSSEASNRLAEGRFTMRSELFIEPRERITSNLVALRPVRAQSGANEVSYARFLQEQIVRNPAHLRDPQTLAALFGEGVPTSAESEVYRGVILYRSGDLAGAKLALESSRQIVAERRRSLDLAATRTHDALRRVLMLVLPDR